MHVFQCKFNGFSPGTPVSSTNKTDSHDITEIVLKVALNTINLDVKQLHDHPGANLRNTDNFLNFTHACISMQI
jgi:hypothetical protein